MWIKRSIGAGLVIAALVVYKFLDPTVSDVFPKCPFFEITGYKCPGCGSQRAIHYLLNFNVVAALKANALLVVAIPYLLAGFAIDLVHNPSQGLLKWRRLLFGKIAIYFILAIIFTFWILRNLLTIGVI